LRAPPRPWLHTLSLHDALPICHGLGGVLNAGRVPPVSVADVRADPRLVQRDPPVHPVAERLGGDSGELRERVGRVAVRPAARILDRKSTRLNSSHRTISYAVFC